MENLAQLRAQGRGCQAARQDACHPARREEVHQVLLRLVRQLPQNSELEHAVHATALLTLWFGTGLSVHDAGINLPAPNTDNGDEKQAFLWRYRINDATKVVASWNAIRQEMSELPGAPTPFSKGGIDLALELLKSYSYDGVRSKEFARVAAECGVSQADFKFWQDRWLAGLDGLVARDGGGRCLNVERSQSLLRGQAAH